MIVLDAGVLIAYADQTDTHNDVTRQFLLEHADHTFHVSALSLAEAFVRPSAQGTLNPVREVLSVLELDVEDVLGNEAVKLATVRAQTGLRMSDALVVHTAQQLGAQIATTDIAMSKAANKLGVFCTLLNGQSGSPKQPASGNDL